MATARTDSANRKLTELSVTMEKGMDLIMPAKGHSREAIQDYVDDCLESRCGTSLYDQIPQTVINYIVDQCMQQNGDLDLAEVLITQTVIADRYFRHVHDTTIIRLLGAERRVQLPSEFTSSRPNTINENKAGDA